MLSALALFLVATPPSFAPPTLWASGFAAPPRIPLVGDVNADGYADLICVYPPGGSIIDVSLNEKGLKPGVPFQALNPWGTECQAAVAGDFDDQLGTDVAGLFGGDMIRLAHDFRDGKFKDIAEWRKLPRKLDRPYMTVVRSSGATTIEVFSLASGEGYRLTGQGVTQIRMQKGLVAAYLPVVANGPEQMPGRLFIKRSGEVLFTLDQAKAPTRKITKVDPSSRGDVAGQFVCLDGQILGAAEPVALSRPKLPKAVSQSLFGDIDADGDLDVIEFRYGTERHTAYDIFVHRCLERDNADEDADGVTNQVEASLGTNPLDPDTDNDSLLDGWEVSSYRDFDFKGIGCNPRRIDLVCLVSRYSNVDEALVKKELERVTKTYSELEVINPDGSKGFSFHAVYLDPVPESDHKNPWWANRDKFRPAKWRGLVHWMQIGPGGGGQADQLGDGGGCGANALWAVFLHEFGHQIGMDHEGFWQAGLCPIYTSLMNYAYSYSLEDDGNKIHYSQGIFKNFVLNEAKLDETLPFTYDQVKFLEKGPYRFRLKQNGPTTLIDWNWNGIFGEKDIRADINYSYSTNAGRRDEIGKIMTAPWLFTHQGKAWAVYGTHKFAGDPKTDPSISPEKPGQLLLRKLKEPFKWEEPVAIDPSLKGASSQELVGDPVAISKDGWIYIVYAGRNLTLGAQGVAMIRVRERGKVLSYEGLQVLSGDIRRVPTLGIYKNRLYVFLWNPENGQVTYRTLESGLDLSEEKVLLRRSTIPVGMAVDPKRDEVLLGAAEDQDKAKPTRWQIRRMKDSNGQLLERSVEWIEGEAGGARGYGRCTVLFDDSKEAGKDGRIYFFGRGLTTKESPWACTYVAHQIADKSIRGGWLVKRFYDEWTQSRSAPAAAWFNKDIIWAYRWVDASQGDRDNLFHVGYRAMGIDEQPMGDHDDIGFFRDIGIKRSIMYLGAN